MPQLRRLSEWGRGRLGGRSDGCVIHSVVFHTEWTRINRRTRGLCGIWLPGLQLNLGLLLWANQIEIAQNDDPDGREFVAHRVTVIERIAKAQEAEERIMLRESYPKPCSPQSGLQLLAYLTVNLPLR